MLHNHFIIRIMKQLVLIIAILFSISASLYSQYKYPLTKTIDSSYTFHNITIKDPFLWMENLQNVETKEWFEMQNDFTDSILNKLPQTDKIYNEISKRTTAIKKDQVHDIKQAGNTFFYKNLRPTDSVVKIFKRVGNAGKEELIASPEMWGTNYQITYFEIDPYQQNIAVTANKSGTNLELTKFYNIQTNSFLKDSIPGIFRGFAGGSPGKVYYVQLPTYDPRIEVGPKEYIFKIHALNSDTLQDRLIASYKTSPEIYPGDDSRYLWTLGQSKGSPYEFAYLESNSDYMEIWFRPLKQTGVWKKIFDRADKVKLINAYGEKLFFVSMKNAPNGKLMLLDMKDPDVSKAKLIAKEKDVPLMIPSSEALAQTKNYLILRYIKNGIEVHNNLVDMRTNKVFPSKFPETTSLTTLTPINTENDYVHIGRYSWVKYGEISYGDIPTGKEKEFPFLHFEKSKKADIDDVVVEEVEVPGYDGVLVPLSIMYRKNLKLNGENVAVINGYGAYGTNSFLDAGYIRMAMKGIVVAMAHVRGGGEKGDNWHKSGQKQSKPNSWKDLISCAEYLITRGFTSSKHLACRGGSAGGILIGRAVTERPDLWACAIIDVGVLNATRDEFSPGGEFNTGEFGSAKNINEFFSLMEMDALLHIKVGENYPAMLITTGWNDAAVASWHPGKFAAATQKANKSEKPILLLVDFKGGHGDSENQDAAYRKAAKIQAFMFWQCGLTGNSFK